MNPKVLIVDDEEIVRDAVRVCLEPDGYELSEAKDGAEALARTRERRPDLIILDLMLPDRWGYLVCEELKNDPATSHIKIVFLTGRKSVISQKLGELRGGEDYVTKPFDPGELRAKVRMLLGRPEGRGTAGR